MNALRVAAKAFLLALATVLLALATVALVMRSEASGPATLHAMTSGAETDEDPLPRPTQITTFRGPSPVPSSRAEPNEGKLMGQLRRIADRDPIRALELAREGNARFSGSADSAERAMVIVRALARQGALAQARGEAERMVNAYAGTPWARDVEQHTGAHPHLRP